MPEKQMNLLLNIAWLILGGCAAFEDDATGLVTLWL